MNDPGTEQPLATGKGFADLFHWRKIALSGAESLTWLDELVAADISDLAPNRARQTILRSESDEVIASFTVAVPGGSILLIQDPDQPRSVLEVLLPLSGRAGVELDDRTLELALFAFPGRDDPPSHPGTAFSAPSCLGAGVDILALAEDHDRLLTSYRKTFIEADDAEARAWQILDPIGRTTSGGGDVDPGAGA